MRSLIRLELRKQSKIFIGLLFIIVLCLTVVTVSVSSFGGFPLGETYLSITVMLQAFGIPFFALLLGAGAGAALRSAERKAEEDVPVRPTKRIFASYITSLFYLSILSGILFVASEPVEYSSYLQLDYKIPLIMVALLPLHSAAFVFSYWLSQALLGSVVAVIAVAVPAYWLFKNPAPTSFGSLVGNILVVLAAVFYPSLIYRHMDWILIASLITPALITTAANLVVLIWLQKRIEKEKQIWLPLKVAIGTFLIGAFALSIWGVYYFGSTFSMTEKELRDTYYLGDFEGYVR